MEILKSKSIIFHNIYFIWNSDNIDFLPFTCQTPGGVLYALCKAVTQSISEAHIKEVKNPLKSKKSLFGKCRGGGFKVEWQICSGAYILDHVTNNFPFLIIFKIKYIMLFFSFLQLE